MKSRRLLALALATALCVSGVSYPAKAQGMEEAAAGMAVSSQDAVDFNQEGIHVYREGSKDVEELLVAVTIDREDGQTGNIVTEKSFDEGEGKPSTPDPTDKEPATDTPKEEETQLPELTEAETAFLDKSGCTTGLDSFKERYPKDYENIKKVYEDMREQCRLFMINGKNGRPSYYDYEHFGDQYPYYSAFVLKVDRKYELSFQQITELYYMFRADNPQYYWLSNTMYPRGVLVPGREEAIATELDVACYGEFSRGEARMKMVSMFANKLNEEYFGAVEPDSSDYDKLLTVHDILLQKTTYPASFDGDDYSEACHCIAGVLNRGYAVCEGYAKMMQLMMNHYGIDNYYVTGDSYPKGLEAEPELHAWNYVEMDGAWYGLDATWDDQEWEGFWHTYFLVGKNTDVFNELTFGQDHIPDSPEKQNELYLYQVPELADERYEYVPPTPPVVVKLGDPTGDGEVNLLDLRLVLRQVCGKIKLEGDAFSAADVNKDGKVDLIDLRLVLRYICGKIKEF